VISRKHSEKLENGVQRDRKIFKKNSVEKKSGNRKLKQAIYYERLQ
jgi:hypothetical protein